MSKAHIIGWDVGGAHLKAALLDADGRLLQVLQMPCALWRGLSELEIAIDEILKQFSVSNATHAITMTGELVDLFANRQEGVNAISRVMHSKLVGHKLFYAGALNANLAGFVEFDTVKLHWQYLASANWLASAVLVAQHIENGLLIDIGSTTSDFVLIKNQAPLCLGLTDAARMQTEELVYTGVIRTPLMAVAQKIHYGNTMTSVAAEYFATTADVYRLIGELNAEDDMADTADGKDKTIQASAQRVARMIGHDVNDAAMDTWLALAQAFKQQQFSRLQEVASKHLARINEGVNVTIIAAGAGSFLARELANNLNVPCLEIADLLHAAQPTFSTKSLDHWANVCLPAYAVARLASKNKNTISI